MKKYMISIFTIIVFMLIAVVLFFSAGKSKSAQTSATGNTRPVIIIDAGHGGIDGGAVGVSGVVEKDINLSIAKKLKSRFSILGYKVIMTRSTDISIHDSSAATIREKKASDLKNRLELTKLYPDSILISIHQNTINIPSVRGAQVFYSPNNPSSKMLALQLQNDLNDCMKSGKPRTVKEAGDNLYIFYNAQNTAVLAECGFLSNKEEESLLCSEEYQHILAATICKSVLTYLKDV